MFDYGWVCQHFEQLLSSLLQLLPTLCTSWRPMPQPPPRSPPRGRMENCRTSLSPREWKQRRTRMMLAPLPTTTTTTVPQTDLEKAGSVNRWATSSLPLTCVLTPVESPSHLPSPHPSPSLPPPYLVIIYFKVPKRDEMWKHKWDYRMCKTSSSAPPRPAPHLTLPWYLRPRYTMQKLETKFKMEVKKRRWWLWNPDIWDPDGNKIPKNKNQDSKIHKKKTKQKKRDLWPLPKEWKWAWNW